MVPKAVFEETTAYALSIALKPRAVDLQEMAEVSKLKIVAVTGVRRSGKSSVMMLLAQWLSKRGEKVGYINAEDTRLKPDELLDDAIRWFGDQGYLLIDEVTSAGDWSGWLARNHEMLKGRLMLIVSSSRSGLAKPSKVLRGRIYTFEIFPLSFEESLRFRRIANEPTTAGAGKLDLELERYLRYGGFPEVLLLQTDAQRSVVLNDYFQEILALDVADMTGSDVASIKMFGRYVLNSPYFSASKCVNYLRSVGLKVGKDKALMWEQYSQDSYLFFFVPVFGRSVKDQAQYPRKAYPVDPGFLYGAAGLENLGRLLECMMFLEIRKNIEPGCDLAYWRDEKGREVDLLVKKGGEIESSYQACWDLSDEKTRAREISSMEACMEELSFDKGFIITHDPGHRFTEKGKISIIDVAEWALGDVRRAR